MDYKYPETDTPLEVSMFYMQCVLRMHSVVKKWIR